MGRLRTSVCACVVLFMPAYVFFFFFFSLRTSAYLNSFMEESIKVPALFVFALVFVRF